MDEKAEGRITFTYQNSLSKGISGLVAPGLISIPSLEATLRMHWAYESRVGKDETYAYSDQEDVDVVVNWPSEYEEMSRDVLVAQAITAEIGKGLDLLGITWRTGQADTHPGSGSNVDRLAELALDESETQLVKQAIELARFFSDLRFWVVDANHIVATRYSEALDLSDVTMDEWELSYPNLPAIEGLRAWMDVSDEMEEEGYVLDGIALVEDCTTVLEGVVDLILLYGSN